MFLKSLAYLILIIIVLSQPEATFQYAYQGLYQWAAKMVPTLFPFMMISSVMVYTGMDKELGNMLSIVLKKIYRFSNYGLYAIFMGFFCGFPMGAKVVSELYENHKISKEEAQALLAFCNNIGPAYFMGIIIPILHACGYENTVPFILGMYGIPAIYGIFIGRITTKEFVTKKFVAKKIGKADTNYKSTKELQPTNSTMPFPTALKQACIDNTQSLIILGGYITFTNAFRIFLDFLPFSVHVRNILSSFLEIIGGVQTIYSTTLLTNQKIFWIMTALCFSGISCLMQTSSFLEKSGLSLMNYLKHKSIITAISVVYYFVLTKPLF